MNCDQLQVSLPELIYGELDADERAEAEAHVAGCAACQELVGELRDMRSALTQPGARNELLGMKLKLAARDALLERSAAAGIGAAGGPLHLATLAVLALCLLFVGFGLGAQFGGQGQPDLVPASGSQGGEDGPNDGGIGEPPPASPSEPGRLPGEGTRPEAWQAILLDAGRNYLRQNQFGKAVVFFRRAHGAAPTGPEAAAAKIGWAEASLRLGRPAEAGQLLAEVHTAIRAGDLPGRASDLQRIAELEAELRDR